MITATAQLDSRIYIPCLSGWCTKAQKRNMKMAKFTTYYETGSVRRGTIKVHKTSHASRAAAVQKARRLSKKTGGYVTFGRSGWGIATYYKGKRVTG